MLVAITSKREISKLNNQLSKHLIPFTSFKERRKITYPQGRIYKELQYSQELKIWWFIGMFNRGNDSYWNCFGIDNAKTKKSILITAEINMAIDGINSRLSGLWAKDEKGNKFLLHGGGLGGGAKGVGKQSFFEHFTANYQKVFVDGQIKEYAFVLQLNDIKMPFQLSWFINAVRKIKDEIKFRKNQKESEF